MSPSQRSPRSQSFPHVFIDANRRFPLTAILVYAAIASLILILFVDQPLAQFLKGNPFPRFQSLAKEITDVGLAIHWFILFAGGALVCFLVLRQRTAAKEGAALWRTRLQSWLFGLTVMTFAGLGTQILKFAFGRPRPKVLFAGGETAFTPFSGANSFPSGHSQAIWSAAVALWFIYPPLRPLYVAVAVLVALSRAAICAHYLSDVVMGAVLGTVFAVLVARAFHRCGIALDLRAHRL